QCHSALAAEGRSLTNIVWDDPRFTRRYLARLVEGSQAITFPVVIGERSHPFPFRTRKLSSLPPMVLRGKLRGRVGHCRDYFEGPSPIATGLFFFIIRGASPPDSPARSLARRSRCVTRRTPAAPSHAPTGTAPRAPGSPAAGAAAGAPPADPRHPAPAPRAPRRNGPRRAAPPSR